MRDKWEEELDEKMLETSNESGTFSHDDVKELINKSFKSILALHEEILSSKNDQIEILKDENDFLKETLLDVQKLYGEDRELLELLKKEIFDLQEELEFTRRKYKMMWNQAIENYSKRSSFE